MISQKRRFFVLLSGGIDSSTCLAKAVHTHGSDRVEAVSIFYGQRHKRELTLAAKQCRDYGITHTILDVGDLLKGTHVLLSEDSVDHMDMVKTSYDKIEGVSPSYVPFRNGLMLSALTAHAQKYVMKVIDEETDEYMKFATEKNETTRMALKNHITKDAKDLCVLYYGAHAEDAANWAYPDCTPEFNGSMANAIYTGSYNTIRLEVPLQWLEKWEVVKKGEFYKVPWVDTWSCYDNGEIHCGECPTCLARKQAFKIAGIWDPTEYKSEIMPYNPADDDIPF